jgi:hypothetical protein
MSGPRTMSVGTTASADRATISSGAAPVMTPYANTSAGNRPNTRIIASDAVSRRLATAGRRSA